MPDAPTPLDLDAIRVRADARRDYADERPESLHVPEDYAALADESAADVPALVEEVKRLRSESQRFYENRNLWQKRAERAEAEVARLRAEVDRLTTRPAPAWDEEAVLVALVDAHLASVRQVMEDGYPSVFVRSNEDAADAALAVVREHLPAKPSREDIYRAWHGTEDPWGGCADSASIERVLDLLPGRSEAKVKAEALREAADWLADMDDGRDTGQHRAGRDIIARLRARADRIEGGADRG